MKRATWRLIGIGAAISLMLVYFIELTSNGLQRMDGQANIEAAYNEQLLEQYGEVQQAEHQLSQKQTLASTSPSSLEEEITQLEKQVLELKKQALQREKKQLEQLLLNENVTQSNVNKFADSTSSVLQNVSSSSMQFVAELFHKVIN